jgi:hypothetical protein
MSLRARAATILLLILLIPSTPHAVDWLEFGGYIKSFVTGIHPAQYTNGDAAPQENFLWANNNRFRMNLSLYPAGWFDFNLSYDLSIRIQDDELFTSNPFVFLQTASIYRINDLHLLIWPDNPGDGDYVAFFQNLDRLFATFHAPRFDLYVGRQAIAWGSAKAVNPTDIIAPFLYNEIDIEDRIGVDAARLRVPAGSLGEVDVGYVAGKDFEWKESAVFARGKFYALKTDMTVLTMAFRENLLAGIDVTRSIGGAGAWCEAAYVWARAFEDLDKPVDENDYLRLSAGADYNFGAGVYTFLEYHYNGAGASDPHDYLVNIVSNPTAYADGAVYLFGRHYLIPGVVWQATALTSVSGQVLANLDDFSCLVAPLVQYNATENLYLSAGGYLALGDNPTAGDTAIPTFNSEFGAYPSELYLFLNYYY